MQVCFSCLWCRILGTGACPCLSCVVGKAGRDRKRRQKGTPQWPVTNTSMLPNATYPYHTPQFRLCHPSRLRQPHLQHLSKHQRRLQQQYLQKLHRSNHLLIVDNANCWACYNCISSEHAQLPSTSQHRLLRLSLALLRMGSKTQWRPSPFLL